MKIIMPSIQYKELTRNQIIKVFTSLTLVLILLGACSSKNNSTTSDSASLKSSITIQSATKDTTIKYAVFTPQLTESKSMPVILLFDPHNQGKIPLERYAPLAEKYGYILIGSMNMRNGLTGDKTQYIFNTLMEDINARFTIDQKRIYLSGFSGGAKVAMMFGFQMPQIAGVIACGGSINPPGFTKKGFCFVGMVGDKDFNYLEMLETMAVFNQSGQKFTSIIFDGKHEWPPMEEYETAIIGIETQAMKSKLKPVDKSWLKSLAAETLDKSIRLIGEGKLLKAHELLNNLNVYTTGLTNNKKINQQLTELENNRSFIKDLDKMQYMLKKEAELRGLFVQAIDKQDITWWISEVGKIKQNTSVKEKQFALASSRLLNYLSMASFMLVNADLLNQNTQNAYKKIQIYELVDPDNADVYLMYARYYLLLQQRDQMVKYYKKAVEKGFTQWKQYQEDPNFASLFAQPDLTILFK